MSKILVTGGAGFIGSNLVDALIEEDHDVVIVDDLSSGKKNYINPKAKFEQVDICSGQLSEIFSREQFDYVFHLAAQIDVRISVEVPIFDNKINVVGSLNVFNNCIKHNVSKIIFFSSGGAICGNTESPASEDFPPNPDSPYAVHKYAAEKNLEILYKIHNVNYIIVRPANIYGPRQYKGGEGAVIAFFTHNALHDQESSIYGDGYQTRDFVYVGDVVNMCLLAMESNKVGSYNVSTGKETNLFELIKAIEKVTGREFKYCHQESRAGEVRRSVLDYSKAKRELGWDPKVSLEEGVRKTINWLKENNL